MTHIHTVWLAVRHSAHCCCRRSEGQDRLCCAVGPDAARTRYQQDKKRSHDGGLVSCRFPGLAMGRPAGEWERRRGGRGQEWISWWQKGDAGAWEKFSASRARCSGGQNWRCFGKRSASHQRICRTRLTRRPSSFPLSRFLEGSSI